MIHRIGKFISRHPDVKKWLDQHPKFLSTFQKHVETKTFFGLPFTLLVVSSIGFLGILLSIIQDYLARDPLIEADVRIANLLFSLRSLPAVHVLHALTVFGSPITGVIIMSFLTVAFVLRRQWKSALIGIGGFIFVEVATLLLKLFLHRTRPDFLLRAIYEDSYSLPSGHATTVAFVFGYVAYLFFLRLKSRRARVSIALLILGIIVLVDLSRVYLGVHYLSDVLAGNAIGLLGLCVSILLDQWQQKRKSSFTKPLPLKVLGGSILVALVVSMGMYATAQSPWTAPINRESVTIESNAILPLFLTGDLPTHSETLIGEPQEPISLVLVVPETCLEENFKKAGWAKAVSLKPSTLYHVIKTAILNDAYLSAPMTPSFYDERPHDFGFEKPTAVDSVRQRHHARFWDTFYQTPEGRVFVGTASLDTGIKWGITHSIAPDIDTERDELISNLVDAGVIVSQEVIKHFVDPVLGQNFATDFFFTNGDAVLLHLAGCQP